MPDRLERGIWPHPPLLFSNLVRHIATILASDRWFPREWHPHTEGQAVYEGGVIEQKNPRKYIYRIARALPSNPFVVADVVEANFSTAEDAARYYLNWDLRLPGDLDGWKVVE